MIKRTKIQLLEIIKDNLERCFEEYDSAGICDVIGDIEYKKKITSEESKKVRKV